jgi:excisionase family DNA binding protein
MTTSPALEFGYPGSRHSHQRRSGAGARPELIDAEALATWLGVEIIFVRRLVSERRITFLKIGKYVRFDPDEVARWVDDQRVGLTRARSVRSERW